MSLCKQCSGSGRKLLSASPYKTKKCGVCNGWRTKGSGKMNAPTFNNANKPPTPGDEK